MTLLKSRFRWPGLALVALGVGLLAPFVYALKLQDLRKHTIEFELAFFVAFALYTGATALALRMPTLSRRMLVVAFTLAAVWQALLAFTSPTLSDDMYRYVWDGRVQAQGLNPYRYPPQAPEIAALRDRAIWRLINRKNVVTVYPPGAELTYAVLWRIWPDNVRWFQIMMGLGGLVAGGLLVGLLRALGRSPARVLIYLWSPLLAFETAHAAHVDGLVLPLLVAGWWARVRERDGLVGMLLGLATAIKIYPALLLPALWRPRDPQGRWRLPASFAITVAACYMPFLVNSDTSVLGYLPHYFRENFNEGAIQLLIPAFLRLGVDPKQAFPLLMTGALALTSLILVWRPAPDGESALRRCIWPIGVFSLFTQNLFAWYMLWLLPLLALFVRPGSLLGLRVDAWTGWWLFCGLVALSYVFFVRWRPVPGAIWAQYVPLYIFLLIELVEKLKRLDLQVIKPCPT